MTPDSDSAPPNAPCSAPCQDVRPATGAGPVLPPDPECITNCVPLREYRQQLGVLCAEMGRREDRFRALLSSPSLIVLLANPDVAVTEDCPSWRTFTGQTHEQCKGQGWTAAIHPDDRERLLAGWQLATRAGTPYQTECRLRRQDGAYRDCALRCVPVFESAGAIREWVGLGADVTERKNAEFALLKSERRFRNYFDLGLIGMGIATPARNYLDVNQELCRITGYSREELLQKSWLELTHPDDQESSLALNRRIMAGKTDGYTLEKRYLRKDGQIVDVAVAVKCARREDGAADYFVALVQDITARKRSEAELQQTQKELIEASRLAGMADVATGVLHNVGNVLNSINIASTCLADGLKKSKAASLHKLVALLREHEHDLGGFFATDPRAAQIPAYLGKLADHLGNEHAEALKELSQLQKRVEHIRDIVTLQQNYARNPGAAQEVRLSELVDDALNINQSSLIRHQIEVARDFPPMPPVRLKKHLLLQILVNLVRNAKDACAASTVLPRKIVVCISQANGRAHISIGDNGVGIAPENLQRVFTYGFTTKKNGHGFGLHSSLLAAGEMGATLTVMSNGPGQGSVFTLDIPLNPSAAAPA